MKKIAVLSILFFTPFVFAREPSLIPVRLNASMRILGYEADSKGITVQVASGGCTDRSDFSVVTLESNPPQISIHRSQPDLCEAYLPYGTKVLFTYKELGLKNNELIQIELNEAPRRGTLIQVGSALGYEVSDKGLILQVASGGCTDRSDFSVATLESNPPQISIHRSQPDLCEAYLPYGTKVLFTYEDLLLHNDSVIQLKLKKSSQIRVFREED